MSVTSSKSVYLKIVKVKQMMLPETREGPVRPVIRTFYDHLQVVLLVGWYLLINLLCYEKHVIQHQYCVFLSNGLVFNVCPYSLILSFFKCSL